MPEETQEPSNNRPWLFQKGNRANPGGRPKGSISLKEYARRYLQEMSDEEKLEFMKGLDKVDIWKLAEGNPHSTSDNKTELTIPQPILGNVQLNNSITEDNSTNK